MTEPYFAYGSNLHPGRMRERAPSSDSGGVAVLDGYALCFHKRGRDGSAKCDVVRERGATVHGVLYRVDVGEVTRLDAVERGYERVRVGVSTVDGIVEATTYRACPDQIASDLLPYRWYRDLVLLGARLRRLPDAYAAAIAAVAVWDDPDPGRVRAMEALLVRLRALAGMP